MQQKQESLSQEHAQANDSDQNYQFYKEYCRLYYANIILTNRLQQLLNEKKDLQFKLNRLEVSVYAPFSALTSNSKCLTLRLLCFASTVEQASP